MSQNINDYIIVENLVSKEVREGVLYFIEKHETWKPHEWFNPKTGKTTTRKDGAELDVLYTTNKRIEEDIHSCIRNAFDVYKLKFNPQSFVTRHTIVRFNRYKVSTNMAPHVDHIHSIFDGNEKGIPILSIVGVLNDDYEGGEFIFNGDYEVKLKAGDILMFPSNFLYEHEVRGVTNGRRVSFVAWGY